MAGKADFTPDEWTALKKSPLMASLVVVAASPSGPLGVMKEMFAVGKLVAETKAKGGSNALVDGIVAELTTREGIEGTKPTEIQGMSPEQARSHALEALKSAAALAGRKAPADADGYKRWLLEVSTRVANASKEGGFLGIGGTLVSEQEEAALRDTASALGIQKS
ncbi:MAG TPA: hypothetical protein VKH82_15470 [Candidatus Binatia bacterium]|nr:hypothetical protein [Candidatus Binatia bacterium]